MTEEEINLKVEDNATAYSPKEFNLSSKIIYGEDTDLGSYDDTFKKKDVKEFIRLLKEKFPDGYYEKKSITNNDEICWISFHKVIDKHAGDKLI